jgi:hypothetical protein
MTLLTWLVFFESYTGEASRNFFFLLRGKGEEDGFFNLLNFQKREFALICFLRILR